LGGVIGVRHLLPAAVAVDRRLRPRGGRLRPGRLRRPPARQPLGPQDAKEADALDDHPRDERGHCHEVRPGAQVPELAHEDAILAATNLVVFVFVMTGIVYATQHGGNPAIQTPPCWVA
jgi:hypothetical protein